MRARRLTALPHLTLRGEYWEDRRHIGAHCRNAPPAQEARSQKCTLQHGAPTGSDRDLRMQHHGSAAVLLVPKHRRFYVTSDRFDRNFQN